MTPTATIALLWLAFSATHLGLASVRVEPRLRDRLGETGFLALYSGIALALFVPLVWFYLANRHAGEWLWFRPVGPTLRVALYLPMTFALVLVASSLLRPSPGSLVPGAESRPRGAYLVTRHPLVLGLGLLMLLHLVPNGSSADVAFFGGFVLFTLLGAWHQDRRKLHAGSPAFLAFCAHTPFLPFSGRETWRGIREIPRLAWGLGLVASLGIRWLHGSVWPH